MRNTIYTLTFILLISARTCFGQGSFQMVLDSATKQYKSIELTTPNSGARVMDHDIQVKIFQNVSKPWSTVDIKMIFGPGVNIDDVFTVVFEAKPVCDAPCNPSFVNSVWLSTKAINKPGRTLSFDMSGLEPGKSYQLRTIVYGLDGMPCSGSEVSPVTFTTSTSGMPKKMLLVIDEEWRNTTSIQSALNQYMTDVQITDPTLIVEKYYIEDNSYAKIALYNSIKQKYGAEQLTYLFFIGNNAATMSFKHLLDESGNVVFTSGSPTFYQYTLPLYKHYTYADEFYYLQNTKYQNTCFRPPVEVREAVFQQLGSALSMGMVIPAPALNPDEKINYVVNYFAKVHRYRTNQISFDKKILLFDSFVSEQQAMNMAAGFDRWTAVQKLNYGRDKDLEYSGDDAIWKADFLDKLSTQSYEIFSAILHGSPDYHAFGINKDDIRNLPALKTQLIDLSSCNVGNYLSDIYLAGEYLGKGNTLNVHAYSDLLFMYTVGGASGLEYRFQNHGAFELLTKGFNVGDAYRYSSSYIESEVILGDPLIRFKNSGTLPVVLENFDVQKEGNVAQMTWKTSSEVNSSRFEIERSGNARKWDRIGEVASGGESATVRTYMFTDKKPLNGQNFYRLKMIDQDATFTFSQIRNANFEIVANAVYPNPTADKILFETASIQNLKEVTISDAAGKMVFKTTKLTEEGIPVKQFTAGLYLVRLTQLDGSVQTQKIVVRK
ncbi:T9SS type A sorting domain-containing protein [Dyadobacter sp. CY323]|uniref:T9SS type A sorting domain-containing protein n=1 Tax=Dyadobacter sp. CY323 TaxID=2907302 RepID=UPI001F40D5AF|nr:T9SS type A sorting domain-containing protein [Dyadobacter sp. CY323]MCE6987977.1 T9SS type A sorting domain-containing protein [Dyadobacter sp. CY323]